MNCRRLLVHGAQEGTPLSEVVGMAAGIVEAEDMLGDAAGGECWSNNASSIWR